MLNNKIAINYKKYKSHGTPYFIFPALLLEHDLEDRFIRLQPESNVKSPYGSLDTSFKLDQIISKGILNM